MADMRRSDADLICPFALWLAASSHMRVHERGHAEASAFKSIDALSSDFEALLRLHTQRSK